MARSVVLVTGLSGLIGGAFLRYEGDADDVRALNRRPLRAFPRRAEDHR